MSKPISQEEVITDCEPNIYFLFMVHIDDCESTRHNSAGEFDRKGIQSSVIVIFGGQPGY